MTMASSVLTFKTVTALSALEVLLLLKVIPDYVVADVCKGWLCQGSAHVAWWMLGINYAFLCLYSCIVYPNFISPLRHVKSARLWLPRLIHHTLSGKGNQAQVLLAIARETPNQGIIALRELTNRRLLVTTPKALADVLVNHPYDFQKPKNMRDFLGKIVGDGIFVVEGDQHKFLRKNSLPAFSPRRIKDLQAMMWKSSCKLMDALEVDIKAQSQQQAARKDETASAGRVEMTAWANSTAMGIIGNAVFGRDFSGEEGSEDVALLDGFRTIFDPTNEMLVYLVLSAWLSFSAIRTLPWRMNRVFEETTSSLRRICLKWVRERRNAEKKDGDRPDLLTLLIEPGTLDDNQTTDQLLTYMAAGHDTTALTFTWACYLLAVHPQHQEALRREVRETFLTAMQDGDAGDNDDGSGITDRLPVLNGIISETLRLYPAVPTTIRRAVRDTTVNAQAVPEGTEILVSPWVINRSTELWGADADDFRPVRGISLKVDANGESSLLPTSTRGADKYDNLRNITFLAGPRSCIGQSFSRAELRCLLAAMVTRFEWTLDMDDKDVVPAGAITIKPQNGLYLRLETLNA